jgi:ubiquinone biosynthesis protein
VFLEGLPDAHMRSVLADQAALPADATVSRRLGVLAQSCPALHKLGQVLARDRRLSPELRGHLQELESLPPAVPLPTIEETLARELGPLDRRGVLLLPPALAEASVAFVIPFREGHTPREGNPRDSVFKVLKPGIEERLAQELELVERVGAYLDEKCDEFHLPHLDYRDSFQQVREKLHHEVRLDLEQRHLAEAGHFYRDEPRVQVPALCEHCTRRVTAMERVWGDKVTDHALDAAGDRRRLAALVLEALVARPVFTADGGALFHGDPHAGNLFLTHDHRLAVLDWSLVGRLGERERTAIGQITLGALTLSGERIAAALADLAVRQVDRPALEAVVDAWLDRVRRGRFPGFAWLTGLLDDAFQTARLPVGGELMLFRKTLHTLEGVLADVHTGTSPMDEVLLREFLRQLALEWPRRWLARPHSRAFATRLSNADLVQLLLGLPWAAAQVWVGLAARLDRVDVAADVA